MENTKVIERINAELEKIDKKENTIYFFVIDTKGNPSGSLEYIYKLAYITQERGYKVVMLYEDEEFVGVKDWLDEKYANLEHRSVASEEIGVSPSDVLFIPEIFANLMVKVRKLPCKRIAILQNYDYMVEQMPFASQWGDLGIMECVTNTEANKILITDVFPYVKTHVVNPYIDDVFGTTSEPKQLIVNVVTKDQSDINRIVKPFYWKYPMYKWVSFRELRGLDKQAFANALREAEITVWIDDNSSFGYTAVEAMKCGNIVLGKITNNEMPWSKNDDGTFNDSCLWFNDFNKLHGMLASVIRAVLTNEVPTKVIEDGQKATEFYTRENTVKQFGDYIENVIGNRRKEIAALLEVNNNAE